MVVDDSAIMRRMLGDIIAEQPDLELAATARNGVEALSKLESVRPDVVTLDLLMPQMDGIETLQKIMARHPLPVIMVSSHTREGSETTIKALSAGAVDFISKPAAATLEASIEELRATLPLKIRAAASVRPEFIVAEPQRQAVKKSPPAGANRPARALLAIGASTGGPKALEILLGGLPVNLPAAGLISLHMPPGFTATFAGCLDTLSQIQVREAANGDAVIEGRFLLAAGGFHLKLRQGAVVLDSGPKVNFVRPSVDVMLESRAEFPYGIIVVMLTGMGRDGAAGTSWLKQRRRDTIVLAQDPATAIIPSMPEAVIKTVSRTAIVPLDKMAAEITRLVTQLVR